ncbi:dioxygenase family protein [Blastococcus tunisiensis]|uniref:Aromatic ring-opening dioxygenase, catalytic subunit, LigB family n=1 Tax=Blastococcus tunisiensis TaxID=1798228 RepID=A0A1I2CCI7_9ACTN|nr:class III extradiol ring-cleavage dioxygenase [Blastococcus sp. DSM 46838]SFE65938.1 Aromatic ring-opening dioxygenase, catalytic subunit, LigB family [Blastococcus sp. DSM 46838]
MTQPPTHPFTGHLARAAAAPPHAAWRPEDGALPALYLSHGAPPLFEDTDWMTQLFTWARSMPRPTAVLIVSAHWEAAPLSLSSTDPHVTPVYDFGGFDPMYYRMRYDTPDATELGARVLGALGGGDPVHQQQSRGLDHGAWVPLKVMYPEADIPVLQLSLPTSDPDRLLRLGARLRALRDEGVLVVGSGFTTHGLPFLGRSDVLGQTVPGWSTEFDAWAAEALARGDVDALADYRHRAPGMPYAHPTVEHFVPLFVTLGAATVAEAPREPTIDGFWMGLSKRSLAVA